MTPAFETPVTSRQNPAVKEAALLLTSGGRKKTGRFLLEGARLCGDAAANGYVFRALFITEKARAQYAAEYAACAAVSEKIYLIDEAVAEKLSDTGSPQGSPAPPRRSARRGWCLPGAATFTRRRRSGRPWARCCACPCCRPPTRSAS